MTFKTVFLIYKNISVTALSLELEFIKKNTENFLKGQGLPPKDVGEAPLGMSVSSFQRGLTER